MTSTTTFDIQAAKAQRDLLDKQIAEALAAGKTAAITKVQAFCTENGLTADDVFPKPKVAVAGKRTIAKPAAKYRDPATGATWTGRGMKPVWLRTAIANGATAESFLIAKPTADEPL